MSKRFVAIWFRYLKTDWVARRHSNLQEAAFVLASPDHGRMIITSVNAIAHSQGIDRGISVADARAVVPSLQVMDDKKDLDYKLLNGLAEWCIRYSPVVSIDLPDGLILDATGCAHLWGGEELYVKNIIERLKSLGYHCYAAMADTIGAAWAVSRFGSGSCIIKTGQQATALLSLPAAALRIEAEVAERLNKLGLRYISDFISMPHSALSRRFGQAFIKRLNQALGNEDEIIYSVQPVEPYQERLACEELITTRTGIEIALQRLLETLCRRLRQEQKGLRIAVFRCCRIDGKTISIEIGTNRPSSNTAHIFKLFEIKLDNIEPALGIEVFILEAKKVEDLLPAQEKLWETTQGLDNISLAELLDRFNSKFGKGHVYRYVPDEHYWPERSFKVASSLQEKPATIWKTDRPIPVHLLQVPAPIEVTAPIPDYPPMLFRYKGKLHKIIKADGPERIEQEWWLQQGEHRDYYYVEDEQGCRYWLFRLGHYSAKTYQWFIHGFFA